MSLTATLALVALLALLIGAWDFVRRRRGHSGIAPARELQRRFGLYAENRPALALDPAQVPVELRHLVPLAERWGIGDDIIRNDLIDKSSGDSKQALHDALFDPYERITEWIDSFGGRPLSPEAEAFLHLQTALDEMGFHVRDEKRRSSS